MIKKWKRFARENELAVGLVACFLVIVVIMVVSTAAAGGLEPIQHPTPTAVAKLVVGGLGIS